MKNAKKHYKTSTFFLHKINKSMQRNSGVMLCTKAGMASLTSNSILCKFTKNDQNTKIIFVEVNLSP